MEHVKKVIFRLLTMTGIAAAVALAARALSPAYGVTIAETIGLGIALMGFGVLILALRTVNEKVAVAGMSDKEVSTQRFMACGLVSYVVGVPVTLGLHLAGVLPWIGVVVYAAPLAVGIVVALASQKSPRRPENNAG